ncbi:MAG: DNA-3-methyladenine glycosylase family protein [Micromonosporaceae bacterium]
MSEVAHPCTRRFEAPRRYELAGTVGALVLGRHDPTARLSAREFWRAARTPDGPGALCLSHTGADLVATGHGPGGPWLVERAEALAGLHRESEAGEFVAAASRHPVTAQLAAQRPGLRLPRSERVFQELLATVLQQKVTGMEAFKAHTAVVKHFGEPAPGPAGLLLPPDPAAIAAAPYWVFHPLGLERRRAETLRRAASVAARLEETVQMSASDAARRLRAIPGVGPWTVGELGRLAYGDPDAVTVGDFHLPHIVAWRLTGQRRGDDEQMLELLEPFAGFRGWVLRLIMSAGGPPRRGPRSPVRSFARF